MIFVIIILFVLSVIVSYLYFEVEKLKDVTKCLLDANIQSVKTCIDLLNDFKKGVEENKCQKEENLTTEKQGGI